MNLWNRTLVAAGLLACLSPLSAHADLLVGNTFDGSTDNTEFYTTGQVVASGLTTTGTERNGYIRLNGTNALVAAELRTFAQPLNFTRFFGFEVTPDLGSSINYENFEYTGFTTLAAGATVGPNTYVLRSSLTGFGVDIPGVAGDAAGTFDLSGAEYQNVVAPIEFRLFIQGTDGPDASPDSTYSLDSFAINGTVPEPASLALLAAGGLCLLRRK